MRLYDISVTIRPDMPVWPGDPSVIVQRVSDIDGGDAVNVTRLDLGAHTGTHVDAPVHFIAGRKGVAELDLEVLIGPAYVVEFDVAEAITAADFQATTLPADATRVLCKTRNSRLWTTHPTEFVTDFVYLTPDAADWLVRRGIRLVGVDYLSVEGFELAGRGAPTHHVLLEHEIVILEGLNLADVPPGRYTLVCPPVKIACVEGAPCRAVLIQSNKEG